MSKRTHEGPTAVAGMHKCFFMMWFVVAYNNSPAGGFGLPAHANKRREVDQDSMVVKIDEELNAMRNSKDANVQVFKFYYVGGDILTAYWT